MQKRLLKESLFTMSVVVSKLKTQTIFGGEGVRQRSRGVRSVMEGGRQERLAVLGGKKLLVAANQNPGELVMVRLGR